MSIENCFEQYSYIEMFIFQDDVNDEFKHNVQSALETIEKCFEQYSFGEIAVAFNGGKDNIAVVHLVHSYIQKKFPKSKTKLRALHIKEIDPFREVEEYIEETREKYNLDLSFLGEQYVFTFSILNT